MKTMIHLFLKVLNVHFVFAEVVDINCSFEYFRLRFLVFSHMYVVSLVYISLIYICDK